MFGKSQENEIVEIKTESLNTFFLDCSTEKWENTSKLNAGHDLMFIIQSDASEEKFKEILDDFITENE